MATENRGISLVDSEGKERFVIPPASAWDSQQGGDPHAAFGPATLKLRQEGEQWLVDLSLDRQWAVSGERKFPLYLDPEIYISQYGQGGYTPTGMDAFVNQGSSGTNYPAQNYTVGGTTYKVNYAGFSDAYRTFTWFDVNNYHDKKIDLAEWWAYFPYASPSPSNYRLKPVTGPIWPSSPNWSATTITAASVPGLRVEQKTGSAAQGGWGITDVEDWVRNWTSGSWGNHGMRVDANGSGSMFLTAQESGWYPSALRLIYRDNNPPPAATLVSPAAGAVGTTTPTLTVAPVTDPDGDPVWYSYRVLDDQDQVVWQTLWETGTSFQVPAGKLAWGGHYRWQVFTTDGDALGWPTTQTTRELVPTPVPPVPDQLAPADATRFTTTPVLQARYQSPQGTSGKVNFMVKNAAGTEVAGGLSSLVASGATASFTPPALADGTYYWQAKAEEGPWASAWSAANDFAVAKVAAAGPGIGEQRFYGLAKSGLTDRMGMSVNPANGNFLLSESDLSVAGTGMALSVDRHYNSQSDSVFGLGRGWTLGTGRDVGLSLAPDGSQQFEGPSGYRIMFTSNPNDTYATPTGTDAVLTRSQADGTFKLFFNRSSSTMNFTAGGYLSSQTDMNGNTISFAYNPDSLSASITDTQARVTSFAYTAGLLHTMTDSSGRTYKYGYDGAKNLITYTDPANKITGFGYDASGRMTQITDPKGNLTKIAYDASSRATKTTRVTDNPAGTGPATSYAYNAGNTVATDANSNNTTSFFDSLGRITKVADAATYTANSNVATSTDTMSALSSYGYDGRDNLTTATSPTGAGSVNGYTDAAHPYFASKATNAQGNSLAFTYDTPGNMKMSQNDLTANNQQKATFNPNGTMATSTDGNNNVTTYGYDPKGNLLTVSAPLGVGNKTYTYDALSRVETVTDNKAQKTTVEYDPFDRVTKLTFAGNATVINTYDDDGNLTRRDDNGGGLLEPTVSTTFVYDRLNRQTAKTVGGVTFTSTFDGVGNLKTITEPPSATISYLYDSLNLLIELTEPGGAKTTFGYDDAYRRTRTSYPNGVVQTATYDASGKTKTVVGKKADGTVLTSFTYDYVNPATSQDSSLAFKMTDAAGVATNYGYDVMDRLIDADGPTGHFEYTYDGNGNRLTQKINGVLTSYTSNAADQLTNAGATTYAYDGNGNRTTQSGGPTLTYNSKDQTIGYQLPALGSPLIDMTYLGSSQNERSKAGPETFTNGPQGVASTTTTALLGSTTANYVRDDSGTLISQRTATAAYYYLFDRLGSIAAMTDSAGNAVNRYVYEPYGNRLSGTVEAVANPWQFAGGFRDAFSGYVKFGERYYAPTIGRWTQPDPSGQDASGYGYAGGDPVNLVDPEGLISRSALQKVNIVSGFVATGATLTSVLCPVCAPVSGPIAAAAEVTFFASGVALAYHDCKGGRLGTTACSIRFAQVGFNAASLGIGAVGSAAFGRASQLANEFRFGGNTAALVGGFAADQAETSRRPR